MEPVVLASFEAELEKIAVALSPGAGMVGALAAGLAARSAQREGARRDDLLQALGRKTRADVVEGRKQRLVRSLAVAAGGGLAGAVAFPMAKQRIYRAGSEFLNATLKPNLESAAERFGTEIQKGVESAAPTVAKEVGKELRDAAPAAGRDMAEQIKASIKESLPKRWPFNNST